MAGTAQRTAASPHAPLASHWHTQRPLPSHATSHWTAFPTNCTEGCILVTLHKQRAGSTNPLASGLRDRDQQHPVTAQPKAHCTGILCWTRHSTKLHRRRQRHDSNWVRNLQGD